MILVTGATGSVGRHVVDGLLERRQQVCALTRNPDKANLPESVEIFQGGLEDTAALEEALQGVRAVYLIAMGGAATNFVEVASRTGVERVVLLSAAEVQDGLDRQADGIAERHGVFERELAASKLEWTFLRPADFAGNSLQWAGQISAKDVVRAPYRDAGTVPIHEQDIAEVAVHVLTTDGHAGAKYQLTGPEGLTQGDMVSLIGAAIGRKLHFEETTPEEAREQMITFAPEVIVDALLGRLSEAVTHPWYPTTVVEDLLGRPARSFFEWAKKNAALFA